MSNRCSTITLPRFPFAIHVFVGVSIGVALADSVAPGAHPALLAAGALSATVLLTRLLWSTKRPAILWLLLGMSVGMMRYSGEQDAFVEDNDPRLQLPEWPESLQVKAQGCVTHGARRSRNGWTAVLELSRWSARGDGWAPTTAKVRLWWSDNRIRPITGDCLELSGAMIRERPDRHTFDWTGAGTRRGLSATLFVNADPAPVSLERQWNLLKNLLGTIDSARHRAEGAVLRWVEPRESAWILAVGAGTRSLLEWEDRDVMTRAGIAHLLAVSGLHLALFVLSARRLVELSLGFFPALFRWRDRRWYGAAFSIPMACGFAVFSGMGVASVRAALFLVVLAMGDLWARPRSASAAIGVAGTLILLWWPQELFSAGFQLSFSAVTALVIAAQLGRPATKASAEWKGKLRENFRAVCRCAVAATLATAPITAFHFGQISLSGVLSNVLVAPVLAVTLIPLSGLALLLAGCWPAALPNIGSAVGGLIDCAFAIADPLSRFFGDPQIVGRPATAEMVAYGVILLAIAAFLSLPVLRREALRLSLLGATGLTIAATLRFLPPSDLEVWFLPVGQGDAALVQTPSGHNILIDTGGHSGSHDSGRDVVLPVLRGLGVRNLDVIVVSHSDRDHVGGMASVVQVYPPREVWWTAQTDRQLRGSDLEAQLLRAGSQIRTITADSGPFQLEGTSIEVVHPRTHTPEGYYLGYGDNDNSLCLRFHWANHTVLFLGDVERPGESLLLTDHSLELSADVVKVAHHGSRTSSGEALLGSVLPRIAVYSAGPGNRYGFPHEEVLRRYEHFGTRNVRLDRLGMVWVRLAQDGLMVETARR